MRISRARNLRKFRAFGGRRDSGGLSEGPALIAAQVSDRKPLLSIPFSAPQRVHPTASRNTRAG
jgi:hypothetical protein